MSRAWDAARPGARLAYPHDAKLACRTTAPTVPNEKGHRMSWAVTASGTPGAVAAALRQYGETLTGQSRRAYDDALPHLVGLVEQNFAQAEFAGHASAELIVEASGSGIATAARQILRECSVSIRRADYRSG
jgi:hypothetical protein